MTDLNQAVSIITLTINELTIKSQSLDKRRKDNMLLTRNVL